MFNTYKQEPKPDLDPHQGGASTAPKKEFTPSEGLLADAFLSRSQQPYLKRLGTDDLAAFLGKHTDVRLRTAAQGQDFMKELKMELLELLVRKNMPVMGMFVGDEMVSGCALLYASDKDIAAYLTGYDFDGQEDKTAVVSAVWTDPSHTGKGHSKKTVSAAMEIAVIEGKHIIRAKVDKGNVASLGLFEGFTFDIQVEGENPAKFYPRLAL
jgi:ribosomal protein S18 acetylase RimI-like enzyme